MDNSSYRPLDTLKNAPKELQAFMIENLSTFNLTIEEIKSLSKRAVEKLQPVEDSEAELERIRGISQIHQHYFNHTTNNKPLTHPVYPLPPSKKRSF